MSTYHTKILSLKAIQYKGTNHAEVESFLLEDGAKPHDFQWENGLGQNARLFIHTANGGPLIVHPTNWIAIVGSDLFKFDPVAFEKLFQPDDPKVVLVHKECLEKTKEELKTLRERDRKLSMLERHGVDNWQWYDDAMEELEKEDSQG